MREDQKEVIDRVRAQTGLTMERLAEELGVKEKTLQKIYYRDVNLTDRNRAQLLGLIPKYKDGKPIFGVPLGEAERTSESAPDYRAGEHAAKLDERLQEKLSRIAKHNGDLDPSQLLRWAAEQMVKYAEGNGGRLLLPIDFGERVITTERIVARPLDSPDRAQDQKRKPIELPRSEAPLRELYTEPPKKSASGATVNKGKA